MQVFINSIHRNHEKKKKKWKNGKEETLQLELVNEYDSYIKENTLTKSAVFRVVLVSNFRKQHLKFH